MENMEIVLVVILIVLVVALFVVSYFKKKKYNAELGQMREELHNGDRVMTDTGVVGEVVDSYVEDEYKYFVLKSGKGNNVGYFTVHANAIYYVFGKDEVSAVQETKTKKVKVAVKQDTTATETAENKENIEVSADGKQDANFDGKDEKSKSEPENQENKSKKKN